MTLLAKTGCCAVLWAGCSLATMGMAGQEPAKSTTEPPAATPSQNASSEKSPPGGTAPGKTVPGKAVLGKVPPGKTMPGITPEREAAVMTFVKRHHPELAELLIHLKEHAPREYDRAVRDLLRTSERLAQVQEKDNSSYELELKLWQARSRAQLFAARLQMVDREELRQQLRSTLNEEYDLRQRQLARDRDRAEERRKSLAEQIDKRERRRDEELEKQFRLLTGTTDNKSSKSKSKTITKSAPAGTSPSTSMGK